VNRRGGAGAAAPRITVLQNGTMMSAARNIPAISRNTSSKASVNDCCVTNCAISPETMSLACAASAV
jgi:hypothetical protein